MEQDKNRTPNDELGSGNQTNKFLDENKNENDFARQPEFGGSSSSSSSPQVYFYASDPGEIENREANPEVTGEGSITRDPYETLLTESLSHDWFYVVASFLDAKDRVNCALVSKSFHEVITSPRGRMSSKDVEELKMLKKG